MELLSKRTKRMGRNIRTIYIRSKSIFTRTRFFPLYLLIESYIHMQLVNKH